MFPSYITHLMKTKVNVPMQGMSGDDSTKKYEVYKQGFILVFEKS